MVQFICGLLIAAVLLGIFILSYVLNKRTPKPEDCEEIDESCINCSNPLCRNRIVEEEKDEEKESK